MLSLHSYHWSDVFYLIKDRDSVTFKDYGSEGLTPCILRLYLPNFPFRYLSYLSSSYYTTRKSIEKIHNMFSHWCLARFLYFSGYLQNRYAILDFTIKCSYVTAFVLFILILWRTAERSSFTNYLLLHFSLFSYLSIVLYSSEIIHDGYFVRWASNISEL